MEEKKQLKSKKKNQKKENQSDKTNLIGRGLQQNEEIAKPFPAFPVVGIGASAGGLSAFEAFFSGFPKDKEPGMAFILIQHLAPDHKSILTNLIGRYTSMDVYEVEDGMTVQVNCIYIIPPGHDMAFLNGALQLLAPSMPRGQRLPIDFFFRSLAQDQRDKSIVIVLSGTGSDGTLGVRAIKGEGGIIMAQTPESTEYDGMPRSAIATSLVDYILPPADMGKALEAYVNQTFRKIHSSDTIPSIQNENNLKKIFILLRAQTGHDFSYYKLNTIMRRIERRMAVHQIETIEEYVRYLRQTNVEVDALFRDLLIGVTNFFRDSDAFKALEETIIPKLFSRKNSTRVIRVWSAGCSTGEEAYSIAILLKEYMETLKHRFTLQIFATDIDSQAIVAARAGIYPASIASDVSEERLTRFFTAEPNSSDSIPRSYRIRKNIRDNIIFSEQNVIKDPPFSKLDLICCRNLMIYLSSDLQKKLIPLFHYALNPGGLLFLGTSESVAEHTDLFESLDRKSKLYQRKNVIANTHHLSLGSFLPSQHPQLEAKPHHHIAKKSLSSKAPLREIAEQTLLKQLAPASALVNEQGDIFYLHGRTGMFLEPDTGEVGNYNILKMAREGLRRDLSTVLHKVTQTKMVVRCYGLRVKTNDHFTSVNLSVCPVTANSEITLAPPLFLVMLEEGQNTETIQNQQFSLDGDTQNQDIFNENIISALKQELKAKEGYLQSANEELETSNEELKSSNEEMQSMNEELQSTNEELETSKEELQSVNEELATVNAELQTKVVDLSRANNDMNNLLSGTGIATIFVDYQLRILRFTPTASLLINLIQSDIGRPIGHIVSNFIGDDSMLKDIHTVLDTLIPKELEVQTGNGKWYVMRILPYRTVDNVIEGAVITFVDITERKQIEKKLEASEHRYRRQFEAARDGILILDAETGVIQDVNPYLIEMTGFSREEFCGKMLWELGFFSDIVSNEENLRELQKKDYIRYEDLPLKTAEGEKLDVEFVSNVYLVDNQKVIQCNVRDITERKQAGEEIKQLLEEKETLLKEVHHRVKNNMSVVQSLLSLQANAIDNENCKSVLQEASGRLQCMITLYNKLYRSEIGRDLSLEAFLRPLLEDIVKVFAKVVDVQTELQIENIVLSAKTLVPLGIILNECITNSIKYAFKEEGNGVIFVTATQNDDTVLLTYSDGKEMVSPELFVKSDTFGLKLIYLLVKQIRGNIRLEKNGLAKYVIEFPKK